MSCEVQSMVFAFRFGVLLSLALFACDRAPEPPKTRPAETSAHSSATSSAAPSLLSGAGVASPIREQRTAPERLVAIGDLHGDLENARRALRLAGAIDDKDNWAGGKLVLVQTGDEIDRGDDDRKILDLIDKLKVQAKKAGGEVIALLGNHEVMNAQLDLRYVTKGGFTTFEDIALVDGGAARVAAIDPIQRARAAAFAPGGRYAMMLAERPIMAKVGDSVFVHGGILPDHLRYGLGKMDEEVRAWLLGQKPPPSESVVGNEGPLWSRYYTGDEGETESHCSTLKRVLENLGAKRMVMGHTPQKSGIKSTCGGRAWRIDVGLAHFYGGPIQVLEIRGDVIGPLAAP